MSVDSNTKRKAAAMTIVEISHPNGGEWVEVYRGENEWIVDAMTRLYALEKNLRVRISRPVFIPEPERTNA